MSLAGHLPEISGSVSEISEPLRLPSSPTRAGLRTGSTMPVSRFIAGFTVSRYTYRGDPITVLLSAVHGKYIHASVNRALLRSLETALFVSRPMTSTFRLIDRFPFLLPFATTRGADPVLHLQKTTPVQDRCPLTGGKASKLHAGLFLLGVIVRESCACKHGCMLSAPPLQAINQFGPKNFVTGN